ncbi:MAG: MBL fold metallo-hydrolase [Deltaproteobacteria bacterium]|nr:MBL fold metallo-hydrolase [Deltaproteobacteria bacterium]
MLPTVPGLERLGVKRVPVPVPFIEAGGPANVYVIEEDGGGLALFDAGIGTADGEAALLAGFRELGRDLKEVRRIFVSHGHIDHYGYARATQELSGAPVFAHPRDHDKITWRNLRDEPVERYVQYLVRLGAPAELQSRIREMVARTDRYARPVENVEPLTPGTTLKFARFQAEVVHMPGHTPGLVCLWDQEHKVLFSDDHLLEAVSPNPLIDLEGGLEAGLDGDPGSERPRHRALVEYLRSCAKVRELPIELVAPGHGAPFSGHVPLIDRLTSFYTRRQEKVLGLLAEGALTAAKLAPLVFPRARPHQLFLILSEVLGNLEVLEDQGRIVRRVREGVWVFEKV